ncbi:MAG: dUTP diphosphatase [Candidatus Pacearchaeota archaeon]
MKTIKIKFKKLHPDAKEPIYATKEAAGFDFYAVEDVTIKARELQIIRTGIAMETPKGYGLQIWDRSGLGAKGIHRFAGLVDSDYRKEIKVVLFNSTDKDYQIKKGERIAQGMVVPYIKLQFKESDKLNETERGEGLQHSTGK